MQEEIKSELIEAGLNPGTWQDSLAVIKSVLSPADWEKFNRLHRNFLGYRSEHTLTAFYDFAFSHDLHFEINRQRFLRISTILECLLDEIKSGLKILDIGAGSGIIARLLKRHRLPAVYSVQDPSSKVREWLTSQGFTVLPHPPPKQTLNSGEKFDFILCIDCLGEVNADEDSLLSETSSLSEKDYGFLLEERFGIVLKLAFWKSYLTLGGQILFWEPFKNKRVWKALKLLLQDAGWKVVLQGESSGRPYFRLELA